MSDTYVGEGSALFVRDKCNKVQNFKSSYKWTYPDPGDFNIFSIVGGESGIGNTDGDWRGFGGNGVHTVTNNYGGAGGLYGGGGGGATGTLGGRGGPGVVRIIWGAGRSFPSNAA